jgi:hypothetical protein
MPEIQHDIPTTQYLTVAQAATSLSVSEDTVLRLFAARDGVIDLGTPETLHKRKKRLLRISRQAFERFISDRQVRLRRAR